MRGMYGGDFRAREPMTHKLLLDTGVVVEIDELYFGAMYSNEYIEAVMKELVHKHNKLKVKKDYAASVGPAESLKESWDFFCSNPKCLLHIKVPYPNNVTQVYELIPLEVFQAKILESMLDANEKGEHLQTKTHLGQAVISEMKVSFYGYQVKSPPKVYQRMMLSRNFCGVKVSGWFCDTCAEAIETLL